MSEISPPGPDDTAGLTRPQVRESDGFEILPPGPNDNEAAVREGDDVVRNIATGAR